MRGRYLKAVISPKQNPTNKHRPFRFIAVSAYLIEDLQEVTLHLTEIVNDYCSKTYGEVK